VQIGTTRVVLRDRTITESCDLGLRFLVSHLRAYAIVGLFVLVPAYVVSGAFMREAGPTWGWTLAVLIAITANVPFTMLAARLMFADNVRSSAILTSSLRALPVYVLADVTRLLILGLSLLFGGIGLIWTGPATFFLPEALLLERDGIIRAFRRAGALSSSEFAEAFFGAILLGVGTLVAPVITDIGGRAFIEALFDAAPPEPLWESGGGWLSLAGFWLFVPVMSTIRFFIYINVRTRIEAWDVQTRFTAIAEIVAKSGVRS
jgi:hypothetical protein